MDVVKKSLILFYFMVILFGGIVFFFWFVLFSVSDIIFVCLVFVCIVLFVFLKLVKNKIKLNLKKDYGVVFGLGVLMVLYWVIYFVVM